MDDRMDRYKIGALVLFILQIFLVPFLGAVLGVLFLIPFRKYFTTEMHGKLPFPEGTATTEILVAGEFYDFKDKYLDGKSSTVVPADLSGALADRIRAYAREAFRSLDAYGMARMDFFLERGTNRLFLNEINLIPGFTNISMYPKLMEASGLAYPELLSRLVELAITRHTQMSGKLHGFESGSHWFV